MFLIAQLQTKPEPIGSGPWAITCIIMGASKGHLAHELLLLWDSPPVMSPIYIQFSVWEGVRHGEEQLVMYIRRFELKTCMVDL
jgi:hypothetical protein